ncbi:MAG TPA: hypothetical protein VG940_07450, partial [Gemmatimonadales bacterium]|nr:hypothetical protein [Gemmatimonadales bacterium]
MALVTGGAWSVVRGAWVTFLAQVAVTAAAPQLSLGPDSRFTLVWGPSVVSAQTKLEDNSFLVEEAYNQPTRVV